MQHTIKREKKIWKSQVERVERMTGSTGERLMVWRQKGKKERGKEEGKGESQDVNIGTRVRFKNNRTNISRDFILCYLFFVRYEKSNTK